MFDIDETLSLLCQCVYSIDAPITDPYYDYVFHLEAGAGNYGKDGHTKTSQLMTVFSEFTYVSDKPNYLDSLPEYDRVEYKMSEQFAVLFYTLDQLVIKYGPKIVFHVNDLFEQYADSATAALKKYVVVKNYDSVIVESFPGNYTQLKLSDKLGKYGRGFYDSVHLKNAEVSFYNYGIDGDNMVSNEASRARARNTLQHLADFSCYGLYFFQIDYSNAFIPKEEYDKFISKGVFYRSTSQWHSLPYVFPTGEAFPDKYGSVYFIRAILI